MSITAVIDYGSGNLRSVAKALAAVAQTDESVLVTSDAQQVAAADRIVLPGVGAFADCWRGLNALPEMVPVLQQRVLQDGIPFLGICVGMQLLADAGYEHETSPGLGWVSGAVRALPRPTDGKIPHMGWNTLHTTRLHPLFAGLPDGTHVYYVHSYHYVPDSADDVLATTDYGQSFTAALGRGNIAGTQFHPEKSQAAGLRFLRNFLDWQPV